MAGPKSGEDFDPTLPSGSQLLGSSLADGVVTLDFNRAFETNFPSSSTASLLALYSLVNSLTCLPGIDKVAFRIEGEPISILGPLDVSEPLGASPDAVLKQQ
jgi:spore germination protein GerM